jgi:sporulation protein YlmC with PRC-barrel domain
MSSSARHRGCPDFLPKEQPMKTWTAVVVMGAVASLGLAPAAFAQTDRSPSTSPPARSPEPARPAEKARDTFKAPDGVMESKVIIGTRVKDSAGKDLGEIDQLLIDKGGKITHAVIGQGGLVGIGETHVVVPWSSVNLRMDPDNRDKMIASMERSTLDSAPRYDRRAAGADRPAASPRMDEKRTGAPR